MKNWSKFIIHVEKNICNWILAISLNLAITKNVLIIAG